MKSCLAAALAAVLLVSVSSNSSPAASPTVRQVADVTYATVGELELKLDLYLPDGRPKPALVVFVHGGSWRAGSRKSPPVVWLTESGYALASISYRLSQQATFPAQLHDCKAAVRWLRAHAQEYGYDPKRIGVVGSSAGGHLAILLATTGDVAELEGTVGAHRDQSSCVQAVAEFYGASDFLLRSKTQPAKTDKPSGNVYQLLGGPVRENMELARQASGVTHVSAGDSPLLVVHGLMDNKVNPYQAIRVIQAYKKQRLPLEIQFVEDGGHGGEVFYQGANRDRLVQFLGKYLGTPR